jgi:very-short-patch-repair endonuclease
VDHGALIALAQRQHGIITRAQALAHGASDSAIRRRTASGQWRRVRPGAYAIGAAAATWEQGVMAAVLCAGDGVLASHRTAARLWGLVDRTGRLEVLVPGDRLVRLHGVTAHRSRLLAEIDRAERHGIPCTSIARTLVDVAPSAGDRLVGRWVDLALREGHGDLVSIASRAADLTTRGRHLPSSLMTALALRNDGYDPGRSALESRVLEALARAGIEPPVRQHPFLRANGVEGYIDLAYPDARLAIELDGWAEHGLRSAFDADRVRGNELVLAGWRLLRFTWSMPDDAICAAIAAALAS